MLQRAIRRSPRGHHAQQRASAFACRSPVANVNSVRTSTSVASLRTTSILAMRLPLASVLLLPTLLEESYA
jgi:hypothetical protein